MIVFVYQEGIRMHESFALALFCNKKKRNLYLRIIAQMARSFHLGNAVDTESDGEKKN